MRCVRSTLRALLLAGILGGCSTARPPESVLSVTDKSKLAISGMSVVTASADRIEFLVVHDNKLPGEPRVSKLNLIAGKPELQPLDWPASAGWPVDLEALAAVPGRPGRYLAMTSFGEVWPIAFDQGKLAVDKPFKIPGLAPKTNLEGLSLQSLDGKLIAIWGHRGDGPSPGVLYWGAIDPDKGVVEPAGSAEILVPYPSGPVRHISDLKLDAAGTVWATAASDPGDDGPFESAVYLLGCVRTGGNSGPAFVAQPQLVRIRAARVKFEAMELVPGPHGGLFLGSDDESAGAVLVIPQR